MGPSTPPPGLLAVLETFVTLLFTPAVIVEDGAAAGDLATALISTSGL